VLSVVAMAFNILAFLYFHVTLGAGIPQKVRLIVGSSNLLNLN